MSACFHAVSIEQPLSAAEYFVRPSICLYVGRAPLASFAPVPVFEQ